MGALCVTGSGRLLVGGRDGSVTYFTNDHMWKDIIPFARVPGPVTSLSTAEDGMALLIGTATGGIYRCVVGEHEGMCSRVGSCGLGTEGFPSSFLHARNKGSQAAEPLARRRFSEHISRRSGAWRWRRATGAALPPAAMTAA